MKRSNLIVAALLGVLAIWLATSQGQQPKKERSIFMRMKLHHAQQVLNGIAVGNFETVETNAVALALLAKNAEFQLMNSPEYRRYSDAFRRNAQTLAQRARDKNLDGAALSYVQLTLNCVDCHKHIREVR